MPSPEIEFLILAPSSPFLLLASCALHAGSAPEGEGEVETVGAASSALTAQQRLAACDQDPRVIAGLVTREICAGADIFFRETFEGNGRSCGTCHPVGNNFTIDIPFIDALLEDNPLDPLFVFEQDPELTDLGDARAEDARPDPREHRRLRRSRQQVLDARCPHTLSLATSITPDPVDGMRSPPVHRTGWSGDGAPGQLARASSSPGRSRSTTRRISAASRGGLPAP